MDSHCPAALFFRAYVNVHQRRYELAQADYEHLLRLVPRHFDARLGLAVTLQHLGKEAEALDQLNILVETAPDSASAFAARASMEQQRSQWRRWGSGAGSCRTRQCPGQIYTHQPSRRHGLSV